MSSTTCGGPTPGSREHREHQGGSDAICCAGNRGGPEAVLDLVERGVIGVRFRADAETPALKRLLSRYANVRISLADACLVRMAEQYSGSQLLTVDGDFRVYRKHGRQIIPVIMPA